MILNNRAQQVSEYAILLAVVVAAIIGMEVYVRRGLQAQYYGAVLSATKELARYKLGQGIIVPVQYEPYYLESKAQVNEATNKQMSFLKRIVGGPRPRTITMDTTINTQSTTDIKQNQILTGNYGD